MVDSPTTRNRLRMQERGTNVNTWGDNLNEALQCIDQCLDGVEAINLAASTSYTLTTTNYTTADEAKNRVLVFSNVAPAGSSVIIPSVEHTYGVRNGGGGTLTIETAAGSGVDIPAGRFMWVYCDGTNVEPAANTTLPSSFTPGLANDPVTLSYLNAALAAAAIPGATGTVKVDALATAGYLGAVLLAEGALIRDDGDTLTVVVDQGNNVLVAGVLGI